MHNKIPPDKKTLRGNFAYQERQLRRRSHIEKKRALRRIFELGKRVEKIHFEEDLAVIYGFLLDAKEQLQSGEGESIRQKWRLKGNQIANQ